MKTLHLGSRSNNEISGRDGLFGAGKKKPRCYGGCNECTVYCGHCTAHCTAGLGATSVSRIWAVEWVTRVLVRSLIQEN